MAPTGCAHSRVHHALTTHSCVLFLTHTHVRMEERMSTEMLRTHVVMPKETVHDIDELVGRRGRSKFLVDAAEEKLRRLRQQAALRKVAGSLKDVDIPGWETPQAASAWVTESRAADDRRLDAMTPDR